MMEEGPEMFGTERTHWRTGIWGKAQSTRWAAVWAMRLALQEGQAPLPLQKKATRKPQPQFEHRALAKPWARMPH